LENLSLPLFADLYSIPYCCDTEILQAPPKSPSKTEVDNSSPIALGQTLPNDNVNDQPETGTLVACPILDKIPDSWVKKILTTPQLPGFQKIFYCNENGKIFSNEADIHQHFANEGKVVKVREILFLCWNPDN
jgi:hypothetical protein